MSPEIQFQDYVRNTRSSAQSTAVLAARLQKAAPEDLTHEEKKALKLLLQRAEDVADVQAERDRLAPAKLRPVLITFVSDWTALCDALAAKARVSHASENSRRASELHTSLFPDGMSFAQTDAETAWSEGHRRLERIKGEKLDHAIDTLLGPEFLIAARASTDALANAIGTGREKRTTPSTTALSEALADFGRAVGRYGRLLAASCDEEDPASVERFLRAVAADVS